MNGQGYKTSNRKHVHMKKWIYNCLIFTATCFNIGFSIAWWNYKNGALVSVFNFIVAVALLYFLFEKPYKQFISYYKWFKSMKIEINELTQPVENKK